MNSAHQHNSWLIELRPFGLTKNEEIKEELQAKGMTIFDFTLGDPKEPTPEFIRKALADHIPTTSQYPQTMGMLKFREACAQWLKRRFQVDVNPKTEILSSNGSKEAIFHIPHVLFNHTSPRRTVVFPQPGYPTYRSGTVLAGGVCHEAILKPEKNYVFDHNDIEKEKWKHISAVWLCYPHNPTGALISKEKMIDLYQWALDNDITLLSDECYVDMFFGQDKSPDTFLAVAEKNQFKNLLCFFSLSKRSGMTGYRSGFVAGDAEKIALFAKYRLNAGLGCSDFIQHTAIAAWQDDDHVQERNDIFFQKRKCVESFLDKNHFKYTKSNATFYIWAQIPPQYASGTAFAQDLLTHTGIMATPGEAFGSSCAQNFRLALVPSLAEIQTCLEHWQEKIDQGFFK